MKFLKTKYYSNCEVLPLWNFFKVNTGIQQEVKYLIVQPDRIDYDNLVIDEKQHQELLKVWDNIFDEYNNLEKNFGVANFVNDRSKILYFYSVYLQEHAMLKSLLYRTNVNYIKSLRRRDYQLRNTSNREYWEDLYNGLKKVENHLSYIESLRNKMENVEEDSKKEGNPYDSIMAWMLSNDMKVDENVTVSRYIKIKEIIIARNKAKRKQQQMA